MTKGLEMVSNLNLVKRGVIQKRRHTHSQPITCVVPLVRLKILNVLNNEENVMNHDRVLGSNVGDGFNGRRPGAQFKSILKIPRKILTNLNLKRGHVQTLIS